VNTKLLGIYLRDHLAGSRAGLELARRAAQENRGNPVGDYLSQFAKELKQERATLEQVIGQLGLSQSTLKAGAAWVMERVGRLKLNGHLLTYSPLSRMMELEGLCVAVQGKLSLWRLLERLARTEARLAGFDFSALITRSIAQQAMLDRLRLMAADTAFTNAPLLSSTWETAGAEGH
jgi:hypothetical protein